MIKIGFITTPLDSGHAVRGVGFYTRHLLKHLKMLATNSDFQIKEIEQPDDSCDIIHYPFFDLFFHTLPIFKPKKTIVTIHDVVPLEFPEHYPPGIKGNLNLALQKISLTNTAGMITDSYASVNSIHRYLQVPHSRIKLIHLASAEIYKPQKPQTGISQKYSLPPTFVLYVGDVNWNKNLPTLTTVCIKEKLDLVLVGKQSASVTDMDTSHSELAHIEELKKLFSSPFVHRLGFVPDADLVSIYNLATVYCQPSFAEGFGLPVLEAMSCGTPVVCSNSHSLPEIGGDAVLYFDPKVGDSLAKLLKTVINDKPLQQDLSKKGITRAQQFSWEQTAKNTLLAYRNFL